MHLRVAVGRGGRRAWSIQADLDHIEDGLARARKGGLIFALGHVGNNEAVAAAVARRGWPINVVADDSTFPEMFERFRRLREAWGVHVIPWRNLREIYTVLRRREMLALLDRLGLPVRRDPGPPLRRVDDAAGRPGDARRQDRLADPAGRDPPDAGRLRSTSRYAPPIEVALGVAGGPPAGDPGRSPTRSPRSIAAAPEQWYSFKPIWPSTRRGVGRARARAAAMLATIAARRARARREGVDQAVVAGAGAAGAAAGGVEA